MPVHQLCRTARGEPISATYGGPLANDKAQNMICHTYTHRYNNDLRRDDGHDVSPAQCSSAHVPANHILRIIICWTSSVGCTDWSIVCSSRKLMHGNS